MLSHRKTPSRPSLRQMASGSAESGPRPRSRSRAAAARRSRKPRTARARCRAAPRSSPRSRRDPRPERARDVRLEVARHPAPRIESQAVRPRTLLLAAAAALAVLLGRVGRLRRERRHRSPRLGHRERQHDQRALLARHRHHRRDLHPGRGRARSSSSSATGGAAGRSETAEGPQIHGNTRLELIWTAIPALILVAIIVITIVKVPDVNSAPPAGSDPLVVQVDAHQFYWEYTYPNGVVSVDLLRLPIDRPVQLKLEAADVIHSWWVPELTGKRDAIPGRTNTLDFTPLKTGVFEGQCAELCGAEHAVMYTEVEVIPGSRVRRLARRAADRSSSTRSRREVSRSASRRGRTSAPSATASTDRATTARRSRLLGARRPERPARASARGPRQRGRPGLHAGGRARAGRTPSSTTSSPTCNRPSSRRRRRREDDVAVRAEQVAPGWRNGTDHAVADHGRPQADRDPLHRRLVPLLRRRRDHGAAHADATRRREPGPGHRGRIQRPPHHARHGDGVPVRHADAGRLRELPRAADDRRDKTWRSRA